METRWSKQVGAVPHSEYPRPSLVRDSYICLNGRWEYKIDRDSFSPGAYEDHILVPFSPESQLSGVNRRVRPYETLWYRRLLPALKCRPGYRWLLHFGAVDQVAVVYLNDRVVRRHIGGYLPFTADITAALQAGRNVLEVKVKDYGAESFLAHGKQRLRSQGMFYRGQSGIWQSVWLEEVPETYIAALKYTPDYDRQTMYVEVQAAARRPVTVTAAGRVYSGFSNEPLAIELESMRSWSPEDPYLYPVTITLDEDRVQSYFAMRKIAVQRDEQGLRRLFLNGRPYFQKGVIDQGYWPDGLYTPPTDEALRYDIRTMKDLGFNLLRKHVKVEPERWYYHCDREGMLVWQDMVSGGDSFRAWYVTYLATLLEWLHLPSRDRYYRLTGRDKSGSRLQFLREMKQTIAVLYNHPSIVCWTLFNEGWGQFDARAVTGLAQKLDRTRLIDAASGWFDQRCGDIRSYHNYFLPLRVRPQARAVVLSEFGGYSFSLKGHRLSRKIYGYRTYYRRETLTRAYQRLITGQIIPNIGRGLAATIFTQLSDIEEEVNGLLTYDREKLKVDGEVVRELNKLLTYES